MARYCGQAIIDALVAAVVVELLIRAWREAAPGQRIRLRQLVLALASLAANRGGQPPSGTGRAG